MELEEVKRKIEGEAELALKMDKVRKTFEKDIENLESMYLSQISSLLPSLTLSIVELEEERRLRGETKESERGLRLRTTISTSSSTL